MNQSANPSPIAQPDLQWLESFLCTFVQYRVTDPADRNFGKTEIELASGFLVEFRSFWLLLTAGHFFKGIDDRLAQGKIEVERLLFVDYLGKTASQKAPVQYPIENLQRAHLDDPDLGLDVCIVTLGNYLCEHFRASGVKAITEPFWAYPGHIKFDEYRLVGMPGEAVSVAHNTYPPDVLPRLEVRPAVLKVEERQASDAPPHAPSEWPWFYGHVPDNQGVFNIGGMSGGPIYGFVEEPGELHYRIVAMQSNWWASSRIIRGVPIPLFMTLYTKLLEKNAAAAGLKWPDQ